MFLELINKDDQVVGKNRIHIQTKPLPKSMQDPVQVEKRTETSAMKLIFVAGKSTVYPFAFDEYGDVRYIMTFRPRGYGYFPLANGRFIVMERQALVPTYMIPHSTQMYEMDWLGRVYRTYYVPNGIHHDVCEMTPGGNLLVVSNSQCGHVEDCIAEVNRQNGRIEKFLDLREVLKTAYRRTGFISIRWSMIRRQDMLFFRRETFIVFCVSTGRRINCSGFLGRRISGIKHPGPTSSSRHLRGCPGISSSIR